MYLFARIWLIITMIQTITIVYCQTCDRITLDTGEQHINCSRRKFEEWPEELFEGDTANVTAIDVSWNQLHSVNAESLDKYPELHQLILATNRELGGLSRFVDMVADVRTTKPRKLCLDSIVKDGIGTSLEENTFCVEFFKRVTQLTIRANNIASLHIGVVHCVPNLQFVSLGFNFISAIEPDINMNNIAEFTEKPFPYQFFRRLEFMEFSRMYQNLNLYEDLYRSNQGIVPDLFLNIPEKMYDKDLEVTEYNENITYYNPWDLKYMYSTHVQLHTADSAFGHLPKLIFLDMSYIQGRIHLTTALTSFPKLQILNLSSSGIEVFGNDTLTTIPHLRELNLSHNALGSKRNHYPEIFKTMDKLEILSLAFNQIFALPRDSFIALISLEYIDLSGNNLQYVETIFSSVNLAVVDLRLNILREDFLHEDLRTNISNIEGSVTLDIGPEMTCTCNSKEFLSWVEQNRQIIIPLYNTSTCSFDDRSLILSEALKTLTSSQSCDSIILPITIAAVSFGALVCALTIVIHRYKIYITWFFYRFKHKLLCKKKYDTGKESSLYDAYVAVAYKDLAWVKDTILVSLESVKGLKIYLYERDSMPGDTIADNIVHGLSNSACVVVILSPSYVKEEWRDWELSMAVAAGKSRIAIIKTGDITPDLKMSAILKSLILPNPSVTFHEWKPGECGETVLMETLELHIRSHRDKYSVVSNGTKI